jgi:hypothetical protein
VSKYGLPPLEISHEGRVFSTRTIKKGSKEEKALQDLNKSVLPSLGLFEGVSHTEYIESTSDGSFYFLETSARVGGAHIVDLIEAATGMNLWAEWAKLETATPEKPYKLPEPEGYYSGLLVSLAKQQWPDLSSYNDPEVFLPIKKEHHAGIVLRAKNFEKVETLLSTYTQRFYKDFFTSAPPKERPVH